MLVRNRTKVPLRIELHRPKSLQPSPLADLPLLKPVMEWIYGRARPILTAEVKPGIEWALRPRAKEGRDFRVRLLTSSGVQVCSRPLRRGQSFDFDVPVPPPPAQLRASALASQREAGELTVKGRVKATDAASKAFGKEPDEDRGSICSTAAPSSAAGRLSFASTSTQASSASRAKAAHEEMQAKLESRRRKVEGLPPLSPVLSAEDADPAAVGAPAPRAGEAPAAPGLLTAVEGFRTCICPRCLHTMPLRRQRPRASIYSGGVSCDRCKRELLGEVDADEDELDQDESFCHCSRCWYDLCRHCAYKEMQDVWWDDD